LRITDLVGNSCCAPSFGLELNEDELKKRLVPWTSSAGRG